MKIVASLGIKNEEGIIERTLLALNEFCDAIIIVDDGSTDRTEEICKKFDKVEWYETREHDWRVRDDGNQKLIAIEAIKKHNPDYVLFLDADEIPFPNIVNFIEGADPSINLWTIPFVHLWEDENHYRVDKFTTEKGIQVNYDPFNGGTKKGTLMKWCDGYDYQYRTDHHILPMEPHNVPLPHSTTNETGILHFGKLSEHFKSGKKDEEYSVMRSHTMGFDLKERIKHHEQCRSEDGLELMSVNPEWHWR
ncbi:MAG: glycosyltransferase family 2 protein [Proteobacteria bacterium]|nr:glycosyltransferase family 2 protein [Pseudomonadota bacterium]